MVYNHLIDNNLLKAFGGFTTPDIPNGIYLYGGDRAGTDFGPVPYGIKEHVQMVEDVLPNPADQQLVLSQTSNRIFRLGLTDPSPALAANGSGEKNVPVPVG